MFTFDSGVPVIPHSISGVAQASGARASVYASFDFVQDWRFLWT